MLCYFSPAIVILAQLNEITCQLAGVVTRKRRSEAILDSESNQTVVLWILNRVQDDRGESMTALNQELPCSYIQSKRHNSFAAHFVVQ